jgi:hypothetical protein
MSIPPVAALTLIPAPAVLPLGNAVVFVRLVTPVFVTVRSCVPVTEIAALPATLLIAVDVKITLLVSGSVVT